LKLPGYKIISKLGSGGMAIVYLAEHIKLGNRVAIKVLSDVLTHNPFVRERFLQEARVMASLDHPGIIQVTDYIDTPETLAIIMEYAQGRTLDEIIGQDVGPIIAEKALPIFKQLLEATSYAHERGIVHRDIKPSNAMVSDQGIVKLGDFGIAKIAGGASMTRTGAKLGTLFYMSPEQVKNPKDADYRSDIYSLGMTLYEMLAGRLPFDTSSRTSEFKITQKIVFQEIELPSEYYPDIPGWLVKVVQKAIAKNPSDRYQNCSEFLNALNEPRIENKPIEITENKHSQPTYNVQVESSSANTEPKQSKKSILSWILPILAILTFIIVIKFFQKTDDSFIPTLPSSPSDTSSSFTSSSSNSSVNFPDDMDFINIPSGSFYMGSSSFVSEQDSDKSGRHVFIDSFELMRTEVTQGMWEEVMGKDIRYLRDEANLNWPLRGEGANYPVYYVSWNDCQEFIDRLNSLDPSRTYRLPSESEWEYACRAGMTTDFYWGDSYSESAMGRYCWYSENSNSSTHIVAQKEPNAWGLYDMSGNVWELCEDKYTADYDDCPTDGSAYIRSGFLRVIRGGGWFYSARFCRLAYRRGLNRACRFGNLGFRLVRSES